MDISSLDFESMVQIDESEEFSKENKNNIEVFSIPFSLEEIKNTFNLDSNINSKSDKDNLLNQVKILVSEGNILKASKYYEKLINSGINNNMILSDYSELLIDLGEFSKAEENLRKIIEHNPSMSTALNNLARVFIKTGKVDEAKIISKKSLKINPNSADTYNIIGSIFANQGNINQAFEYILNAIKRNPSLAKPYINLGTILNAIGKPEEAIVHFEKALEIDPNNSFYIIDYISILSKISELDKIDYYLPSLYNLALKGRAIDPFKLLHLEDDPEKDLKRAISFYNSNYNFRSTYITEKRRELNKDKINIAYLSADFNDHPVMNMIARIFELHDKSKFNIFIYSFGYIEESFIDEVNKQGCIFINIKELSIEDSVNIIRLNKIDIAIDLMGYTKNNRMSIFSHRIAPIQINYLGYPSTSGAQEIDYILADKVIIPLKSQKYYSEKTIYMPNCYMPYSNKTKISEKVYSRNEFGLKDDDFILAAFHSSHKITTKEIESWARLLKKISNSILWISYTNKTAERNIKYQFYKRGIKENKIIFSKKIECRDNHLSRHSCADLFLVPQVYNANRFGVDMTKYPTIARIDEALSEIPAFKKAHPSVQPDAQ